MKRLAFLLFLFSLFYFGADFFSIDAISAPLLSETAEPLDVEAQEALSQPYQYLAKGKQAYAFLSGDGKWVLKFFNQKYFQLPFWARAIPREKTKREKRRKFYLQSYRLASKWLKEETGIIYLHQGPSLVSLPTIALKDRLGRPHRIDLNTVPFVLQRKADPLYPTLKTLPSKELDLAIKQFLTIISSRINQKIGDGDHEVENNFGWREGRVIHLDPGRLYLDETLWSPKKLKHEWWSATHRFRKWLVEHFPEKITLFDSEIETNLERVLQQSQAFPLLQRDGLPQG